MISWLTSKFSGLAASPLFGWPALAVALLIGIGCYGWGHTSGYGEAQAKGKADLQELRAEYATAGAESLAKALDRNIQLVEAGNAISADLITTRAALSTARADINRRINHAVSTADPACVFGPELVGLCREAFYGLRADPLPEGFGPGGGAARSGEAAALGPRLRQGASVADLMAWHRDMGNYVLDLERTSAARLHLLEAWSQ